MSEYHGRKGAVCRVRWKPQFMVAVFIGIMILCSSILTFAVEKLAPMEDYTKPKPSCYGSHLSLYDCISTGFCCGSAQNELSGGLYKPEKPEVPAKCDKDMTVVYTACSSTDVQNTITSLRSMLSLSPCAVHIVIIAATPQAAEFQDRLSASTALSALSKSGAATYEMLEIRYPEEHGSNETLQMSFCTSRKLFLPSLLPTRKAVIHLAPNTTFTAPVENLWNYFHKMSPEHIIAMTSDGEDPDLGWYNQKKNIPYVQPLGVSSNVLLLNLTKMRDAKWEDLVHVTHENYKDVLLLGAQDILNAMFYIKAGTFLLLPCRWNFRYQHCHLNYCNCRSAKRDGVGLTYLEDASIDDPVKKILEKFAAVFDQSSGSGTSQHSTLLQSTRELRQWLSGIPAENCKLLFETLAKNLERLLKSRVQTISPVTQ